MKIFAGYKYQRTDSKIEITGSLYDPTLTVQGDIDTDVEAATYAHMPTAGAGFVFPLSDTILLSLQAGVIYLIADCETKTEDHINGTTSEENYSMEKTFGINTEVSISMLSRDCLLFQLGYRYQGMKHEKPDTSKSDGFSIWDSFHGVTFSALYLFDI